MRLDRNPAACSNDYFVLISMPSIGFSSLQSPRCKPARNAVIVCVVNTSTLRERPVPARFICVASSMTPSHLQPVDMLLNGSVLVSQEAPPSSVSRVPVIIKTGALMSAQAFSGKINPA